MTAALVIAEHVERRSTLQSAMHGAWGHNAPVRFQTLGKPDRETQ